jgi:hypothetical protein
MDRNVYYRQPFGGLSWPHLRQTGIVQNQGNFENLYFFVSEGMVMKKEKGESQQEFHTKETMDIQGKKLNV